MVWVDLGGGTAENVNMMANYMDLKKFKKIYIVDLCASLCEQAKAKVAANGWKNVEVIQADACQFAPPEGTATLVTFSYSLSSECLQRNALYTTQPTEYWNRSMLHQYACTRALCHERTMKMNT